MPKTTAIEFELTVRHRPVYPDLFILDTALISLDPLLEVTDHLCDIPGRILRPLGPDTALLNLENVQQRGSSIESSLSQGSSMVRGPARPQVPSYLRQFSPRLEDLDISMWTDVSISNDLAADIISSYLDLDHHIWGLFDVELFLEDLLEQRERFCSSFMVNALMFCAAVSSFSFNSSFAEAIQ